MTATASGTADDYLDLLDRLHTFLTTDADLVNAGQEWESLAYDGDGETEGAEAYLRGPGLAGQDSIYVGLRAYANPAQDWFNIACRPFLGYIGEATWETQPGAGPERGVTAWDQAIPYWFVADGRRFIAGFRVSTVDQILHCGLITPYATPLQYQLPMMVAGTMPAANEWRWSHEDTNHRFFTHGGSGSLRPLRFVEGTYLTDLETFPHSLGGPFRETYGDAYPLLPVIFSRPTGPMTLGRVEGLYWIPGFSQASGNTLTIGGTDYVVLQNVFRTGINDYLAIRLT